MFEDIQDYDLLLVLPASCMARRNHGTSSCLPSGQAVRLPDRLGRFAVRSNRALVARVRCVVRCTRSLPPSSSCGSNRCEHLTTYVSLARYAGTLHALAYSVSTHGSVCRASVPFPLRAGDRCDHSLRAVACRKAASIGHRYTNTLRPLEPIIESP